VGQNSVGDRVSFAATATFDFDEAAQARAFAERFAGRMVAPGPV
jgi:hypothetical protein